MTIVQHVEVAYTWLVESDSETCMWNRHGIKAGETILVVYFPKVYFAFCREHGEKLGLMGMTEHG